MSKYNLRNNTDLINITFEDIIDSATTSPYKSEDTAFSGFETPSPAVLNVFEGEFLTQIVPVSSLIFAPGENLVQGPGFSTKPVTTHRKNLPTYPTWKMFICCLCIYHTYSVIELYKHSNNTHHQELNSYSRYSLTSCTRCTFTHSNPICSAI